MNYSFKVVINGYLGCVQVGGDDLALGAGFGVRLAAEGQGTGLDDAGVPLEALGDAQSQGGRGHLKDHLTPGGNQSRLDNRFS